MHAGLKLAALLLLVPLVNAGGYTFQAPAQAAPDLSASGVQWALILLYPQDAAQAALHGESAVAINHTRYLLASTHRPGGYGTPFVGQEQDDPPRNLASFDAQAETQGATASIYVEGHNLSLAAQGAAVTLGVHAAGDCVDGLVTRQEAEDRAARTLDLCPANQGAVASLRAEAAPLRFQAHGELTRIEWSGLTVACPSSDCPTGGPRTNQTVEPLPGYGAENRVLQFEDLQADSLAFEANGTATGVFFGAMSTDVRIDGWVRLPLATGQGCAQCVGPQDQTFRATGNITLHSLHPEDAGHLQADVGGRFDSVRFDEQPINPALLSAATLAGVALAVGLAFLLNPLLKLLASLFTRVERKPLEHPRSKELHDLIVDHPGLSESQLQRMTQWGKGSLNRHLKRLCGEGLVAAHPYRNTVRYYENHHRYDETWQPHAALLHNDLSRRFHDWLLENPAATQSAALAVAHGWGAKRSTAQRSLQALVQAGLVHAQRNGRTLRYTASSDALQ